MLDKKKLKTGDPEREIFEIVVHLPPEQKSQALAFVRFLAFEALQSTEDEYLQSLFGKNVAFTAADEKWDQLLASEEGQNALDHLADEALAEIRAGKATAIVVNEDGELDSA